MAKYDKLVRDRIPEIIRKKGTEPKTHIAGDDEYWRKLKDKLGEEVKEFLASESAEEIADILEVLEAICERKGYRMDEVMRLKSVKVVQRGAFKDKIILEES
jgi:predicted house-cleaning noncanonical NTP pyrophosphatase (MazG superfamily)